MNRSSIDTTKPFEDRFERLTDHFPRLEAEMDALVGQLVEGERPGDRIPNVGYPAYKVRLKNPDANRGKSGGFRVIYYVRLKDRVVLLTIYTKSQQENIPAREIRRLIEDYLDDSKIETESDPS